MKFVDENALRQNITETKDYVDNHGGHKVINSSGTQMTARAGMQFSNMSVSDDSTNNKTVIRQTQVVATKAEWDAMTPDPNVTYYLPWMSNTEYAEDRTPIGTVISVTTAKTGEVTGITTPTGEFPSSDYLVCDGAVKNIADYPKLADWFLERYGSKNYFDGNGTTTFAVPNFSADFPTNGILSIKAKMTSTQVTYAEVNDSLTTEDNVWSAEKVNDITDAISTNVGELSTSVSGLSTTVSGHTSELSTLTDVKNKALMIGNITPSTINLDTKMNKPGLKMFWVNCSLNTVTGTKPYSSGYGYMLHFSNANSLSELQVYFPYAQTVEYPVKYRLTANNQWYTWREFKTQVGQKIDSTAPSDYKTRNINTPGGAVLKQLTVTPGTWILNLGFYFSSLVNNHFLALGYTTNSGANMGSIAGCNSSQGAVTKTILDGWSGIIGMSSIVTVTSNTTYYVKALSDGGGYNSGSNDFYAIRIA